ncbi:4-amino-4-deoxychorismate lyase, partial [Rhizobium ruizarguesonis]
MSDTTNQSNDTQAQKGPIIPKSPSEALRPERVPEPPKRSKKARG